MSVYVELFLTYTLCQYVRIRYVNMCVYVELTCAYTLCQYVCIR